MKNRIILLIFTIFLFNILTPFYSYASSDTSYVWSQITAPTLETVSSLNKDKR